MHPLVNRTEFGVRKQNLKCVVLIVGLDVAGSIMDLKETTRKGLKESAGSVRNDH